MTTFTSAQTPPLSNMSASLLMSNIHQLSIDAENEQALERLCILDENGFETEVTEEMILSKLTQLRASC